MFVMRVVVQVSKMKKIIVGILCVVTAVPSVTLADGYHHGGGRGGINPWPIVAGAVIGGLLVGSSNRAREPRYTTVCEDVALYDQYGNYVRTERRCRKEWTEDSY